MVDGYFENTTASTTSRTLTTDTLEVMSVDNDGVLTAPPIITLTLTATCDLFQVEIGDGYGFRLEYTTWQIGDVLTYNCGTGVFTVNGNIETGLLTAGSVFELSPGTNTLYIYGAAGTLTVSINERFI
jgi:phage-related protein